MNRKGGAGKSSVSVHVAGSLAASGLRVVVLDADPQGSATSWAEEGRLPMPVVTITGDGLVEAVDEQRGQGADLVVIDTPPGLPTEAEAAAVVADLVVIPCCPSPLDLRAATAAVDLIRHVREVRGDGRPACLLVPNRVDARRAISREIGAALYQLGEQVAPPLGDRVAVVDAVTVGEHVGQFAPRSTAAREVDALAATIRSITDGKQAKAAHGGSR